MGTLKVEEAGDVDGTVIKLKRKKKSTAPGSGGKNLLNLDEQLSTMSDRAISTT